MTPILLAVGAVVFAVLLVAAVRRGPTRPTPRRIAAEALCAGASVACALTAIGMVVFGVQR